MDSPPQNHLVTVRMLASGSGGNSILVSSDKFHFLIDAGLTCRELERRLALAKVRPSDLAAVFITHEHHDHIRGAGVLSRKYQIPIYLNEPTRESARSYVGEIPSAITFQTGDAVKLGNFKIQTYPVPHDASEPVGLCIENSCCRIGVALDMGYSTKLVKQRLMNSNMLILEFNHDPEMLKQSDRPWELKQRILSNIGHMSNEAALRLLNDLIHERLRTVVLAHLSQECNCRDHAFDLVKNHLREIGRSDIHISVGDQDEIGLPIQV